MVVSIEHELRLASFQLLEGFGKGYVGVVLKVLVKKGPLGIHFPKRGS